MKPFGLSRSIKKKYSYRGINVELTNNCNLHCPLCSTGSGENKKNKGMMELNKFIKFMVECNLLFDTVDFFGSGEPTLHPQFIDFVEYAVKLKKLTTISTNGAKIEDYERIVSSGLHQIFIDVDGVSQSQHEIYRVGSRLESVLNKVEGLVREKSRQKSAFPEIYINTLINCYNETDYNELIEMAKGLGVNGIRCSTIIDDLFKTSDWYPVTDKFKHVKCDKTGECNFKQSPIGILSYDGEVQLCCMTPHHDQPMIKMNAFRENNILEKMDSEEFFKITRRSGDYKFCKNCFLINYEIFSEKISFIKNSTEDNKWLINQEMVKSIARKSSNGLKRRFARYFA